MSRRTSQILGIPRLFILRGLPGSGKSSLARVLARAGGILHVEPDMMITTGGSYQYDALRWRRAVSQARTIVTDCAYYGADCIYSDVLATSPSVKGVRDAYFRGLPARLLGRFDCIVIRLDITLDESRARNVHGVRDIDLVNFARFFQDFEMEGRIRVTPMSRLGVGIPERDVAFLEGYFPNLRRFL